MRRIPNHRGAAVVVVIGVLIIMDLIIVGVVISNSRSHDLTARGVHTVQAFYASEAGINMGIRELILNEDQDGDCAVGSVSHDGAAGTDISVGDARFMVTAST